MVGAILLLAAGSLAISYHSPRYDRNYQDSQVGSLDMQEISIFTATLSTREPNKYFFWNKIPPHFPTKDSRS